MTHDELCERCEELTHALLPFAAFAVYLKGQTGNLMSCGEHRLRVEDFLNAWLVLQHERPKAKP